MLGAGLSPKQMEAMFKKLGIKTREIKASEVVIRAETGDITIKNPKITEIDMKGVITYQISGDVETSPFSDEDVKLVMEKTGKTAEEAKKALLETNGDIAEAILKLSQQ